MTHDLRSGGIAVLDFGSQYTQLIARRIRELGVYAEVFAFDAPLETINRHQPKGYILSGGPNSIYEADAPQLQAALLREGQPILGVCYGMQALTFSLGGKVAPSDHREYGQPRWCTRGAVRFRVCRKARGLDEPRRPHRTAAIRFPDAGQSGQFALRRDG